MKVILQLLLVIRDRLCFAWATNNSFLPPSAIAVVQSVFVMILSLVYNTANQWLLVVTLDALGILLLLVDCRCLSCDVDLCNRCFLIAISVMNADFHIVGQCWALQYILSLCWILNHCIIFSFIKCYFFIQPLIFLKQQV